MYVNLLLVPVVTRECLQVEDMGKSVEEWGQQGKTWCVGRHVKMRTI